MLQRLTNSRALLGIKRKHCTEKREQILVEQTFQSVHFVPSWKALLDPRNHFFLVATAAQRVGIAQTSQMDAKHHLHNHHSTTENINLVCANSAFDL